MNGREVGQVAGIADRQWAKVSNAGVGIAEFRLAKGNPKQAGLVVGVAEFSQLGG